MRLFSDYVGAAVRRSGSTGRILAARMDSVDLEWVDDIDTLSLKDPSLQDVEVLDLYEGWLPGAEFMPGYCQSVPTETTVVLEELEGLLERRGRSEVTIGTPNAKGKGARKHNPFKDKDLLGKGPLNQTKRKKGKWKCKCDDYNCNCSGPKGKSKKVHIKRNYKAWYNRIYMDFLQGKTSAKHMARRNKSKGK